jgi:hypothetical protein
MKIIITESQYKRILREEEQENPLKKKLRDMGIERASKLVGGISNVIDIVYDGNILSFSEDTTTPLAYMSLDRLNLYLHKALVNELGLKDIVWAGRNEKELGKFGYGSKNGMRYAFNATLAPTTLHNQNYYKVVGTSGDSGFGYSFITKKNTLGVRYRQQIFQQIIDKYNLSKYMGVKTFY